ncbi:hypothetical protein CCAX7_17720 [Capsulimonas corticalis]|uniref:Uncharacterized protein n=2 Tax=Capsulimonas corticalis TaxID=2219043 RepID=A0A9N7QAG3_9BACT|nr:hypothetical protein CCAX7_17720 [Capsulimonas corticalis]
MFYGLNSHRRFLTAPLAAMAAITLSVSAPSAFAQSNKQVVLRSGTVIPVKLNTELSSNNSNVGDSFTASVDNSKQAYDDILHNATVEGVVQEATPQEGKNPGTLKLAFKRLRLSDGRTYSISGKPTGLDSKSVKTGDDGVLQAKPNTKNKDLTYAGYGAGAGVLASVLGGGKLKLENILIGAALGYGASQLTKSQDVHDVDLKEGTAVGVLLDDSVKYYHRRTGSTTQTPSTGKSGKYYTYQGHPYFLNSRTGERTRLD